MRKTKLSIFECQHPSNIYKPPVNNICLSHDDYGNRTIYKSDGFKYVEIDTNAAKKNSSKNYIISSNSYRGIIIDKIGSARTIVLYNKNGIKIRGPKEITIVPYSSLSTQIEKYPNIAYNTEKLTLYQDSTAPCFMVTGTNVRMMIMAYGGTSYLLEGFCPPMTKPKVAEYYSLSEDLVVDKSNHVQFLYEDLSDFFNMEQGYYTAYIAPIAVRENLRYILIIKNDDNSAIYFFHTVSAYTYSKLETFKNGLSFTIMAFSRITEDTLVKCCGDLNYLMPLRYNKEENKLYYDGTV